MLLCGNKLHVDRHVFLGKRFVLKMKLTGHSVVEKKYNRHVASIAVLKYHITVYWQFMQMIE